MAKDWVKWHADYEDPSSALSERLAHATSMITNALNDRSPGPIRVLGLCAGDARDLSGALREHRRRNDVTGCLIELDETLASRARRNLAASGVTGIEVREADAGVAASFAGFVPVDILLLVGIFGNVSDADIETTISAVPAICNEGADVIWTRHRRAPDLTPSILEWFDTANCQDLEHQSPPSGRGYGIGRHRVRSSSSSPVPDTLFRFRDDLW